VLEVPHQLEIIQFHSIKVRCKPHLTSWLCGIELGLKPTFNNIYIYIYVYMYICIYVCMYICIYVCIFVKSKIYNLCCNPMIYDFVSLL